MAIPYFGGSAFGSGTDIGSAGFGTGSGGVLGGLGGLGGLSAITGLGSVLGGYLQGQGQKAGYEALAKANRDAAFSGFLGQSMALNSAQAARSQQFAQNTFNALSGDLFSAPIQLAYQRIGKDLDYNKYMPMERAANREESNLDTERQLSSNFRNAQDLAINQAVKGEGDREYAMTAMKFGPFAKPYIG